MPQTRTEVSSTVPAAVPATGVMPLVPAEPTAAAPSGPVVEVEVSGLSHTGLRRSNNEDHFLISQLDRTWRTLMTNVESDALPQSVTDTVYGMVVADGMGGHAGGEVASRTAITAFVDLVLRTPNLIVRLNKELTEAALQRLAKRFEAVKEALVDAVRRDPSLSGMGTTMTLACSVKTDLLVGHVGDSRAYLFRRGTLDRLTRDQTMGQFLKDTGVLSEAELAVHPLRHVLTGVLGTQGSPVDVDLRGLRLEDGDQVLLCTDGLTEMVNDAAIADVLAATVATSAQDACQRLIDLALANGGKDNVTAVLSRYRISTDKS